MGYKRKARILFLSDLVLDAKTAMDYALALGSDWMDANCACCPGSLSSAAHPPPLPCPIVNSELLHDIDLLVTLGQKTKNCWSCLPCGLRTRHFEWTAADDEARQIELRQLVAGIIGGLKMLSRSGGN